MKKLFIETFNGYKVASVIWNGKVCWVAIEIAKFLGYEEASYAIANCLKVEKFREGVEFEILKGADLKSFKSILGGEVSSSVKFAPKMIIFYEPGLYGFLAYTEKPLGVTFRTWIREEVVPQIRATGAYVLDDEYYNKTYNSDIEFVCNNDIKVSSVRNDVKGCEIDSDKNIVCDINSIGDIGKKHIADKNLIEKIADNVIIFDKYLEGLSIADEDKFLFLVSLYKSASIDIDLGFINSNKLI